MKTRFFILLIVVVLVLCGCVSTDYYTDDSTMISSINVGKGKYPNAEPLLNLDAEYAIVALNHLLGNEGFYMHQDGFSIGYLSAPVKMKDPSQYIENMLMLTNAANPDDYAFLHFSGTGDNRNIIPSSAGGYVLYDMVFDIPGVLDLDGNDLTGHPVVDQYTSYIPSVNEDYVYPSYIASMTERNKNADIANLYEAALEYVEKELGFKRNRILYVGESLFPSAYYAIMENGEYYKVSTFSSIFEPDKEAKKPSVGYCFTTTAYGDTPYLIDETGSSFIATVGSATMLDIDSENKSFLGEDTLKQWSSAIEEGGFLYSPNGNIIRYDSRNKQTIITDYGLFVNGPEGDDLFPVLVVPDNGEPVFYVGISFADKELVEEKDAAWAIPLSGLSNKIVSREDLNQLESVVIKDMYDVECIIPSSALKYISEPEDSLPYAYTCYFEITDDVRWNFSDVVRHLSEYLEAPQGAIRFNFEDESLDFEDKGLYSISTAERVFQDYYYYQDRYVMKSQDSL